MIITRTPYRVSLFGGGTDYPDWFRNHGGIVVGATINKYCYISCRTLPPFFDHKHRIVYSQIESVKTISEIKHPSVRAILEYIKPLCGLEIHHDGDLPARSGLGSSSAFTVGLLNALKAHQGQYIPKIQLAELAIHIEQNILKEHVGSQDQILAAHGGFNKVEFGKDEHIDVSPVVLTNQRAKELQDHLMLFFTGVSRIASEIAESKINNIPQKTSELTRIKEIAYDAIEILNGSESITQIGELLHESWLCKRELSNKVSNYEIDEMYEIARKNGAIGGKILGAGGGGFMLFFVAPKNRSRVLNSLKKYIHVPFSFESAGSRVVMYQPDVD